MARLYANENMPLPVAQALRQLGHDVWTTADAGNAGQALSDAAQPSLQGVLLRVNRPG